MDVWRFSKFGQGPNVVHGISTTELGSLSFRQEPCHYERVCQRRIRFISELDIDPEQVVGMQLEHGCRIVHVNKAGCGRSLFNGNNGLMGDVFITTEPDVFLFFLVADCLALFLYEPEKRVCALVHAGWKGLGQHVVGKAVTALAQRYGCNVTKIEVGLSPMQRFSTNPQVVNDEFYWNNFRLKRDGVIGCSLIDAAKGQLYRAGIDAALIDDSGIDTVSSPDFFSHRRWSLGDQRGIDARFGCLVGYRTP